MKKAVRRDVLILVTVGLAIWGVFLFFQNSYFGSFFYGVPTPVWAAWVGQLPIYTFNVIDTLALALVIIGIVVELSSRPRRGSLRHGTRGSAVVGGLLALVLLLVVGAVLFMVFHITFSDLINGARGFFEPGH